MNEQQSIADHRHGLRFVDDDGRCLACALVVAEERIRELEAIVKDDKRCMESLRSLLECCPEGCPGEQPDYRGIDGVEQQGWWFRDEAIDRLNNRIRACEAAEATTKVAEKARQA